MKFRLNNEEATFNICRSMKHSAKLQVLSAISYKVESLSEVQIEERLGVEALATVIMNLRVTVLQIMGHWLHHFIEVIFRSTQRNWIYI